MVLPAINSEIELADLVNRLSWGLPYKKELKVCIPVSENLLNIELSKLTPPSSQKNYISKTSHFKLIPKEKAKEYYSSDSIFIHKKNILNTLPVLKNFYKTEIIDPEYFSATEASVWRSFYNHSLSPGEKEKINNLSQINFSKLAKNNFGKQKAFCFVTGPSFDKYADFEYEEDSFKVICNSIVKNKEFLEYIKKPDLLVFADPVFHFSPCLYSAIFREQVLEVVEKYKCPVMVPAYTMPLLLHHYPVLKEYLIGVVTKKRKPIHFPSHRKLYVKSTSNILTMLMIPAASAIANNIYIIGADGRKKEEKYFWKHSSSVQFDELMQTAFETHPSFFRDRDYADYYEKHCQFLEELINFGEGRGKKYYSLTPSYIPALEKRHAAK